MYEFTSRVRYSEIGSDYHMKLSSLIARMQDCCVFHSSHVGFGPDIWISSRCAWLVLTWQVRIHSLPVFETPVTTRTWAYSFRGFEGMRNFTLRDDRGTLLADANSRWLYFNLDQQKPVRVPPEESAAFGLEPKLEDFPYAPRRIALPEGPWTEEKSFEIVPANIDTNEHVNNLQYIDMALSYLPKDVSVSELRVEYVRQSVLGDRLTPRTARTDDAFYVSLENEQALPCANLMFLATGDAP